MGKEWIKNFAKITQGVIIKCLDNNIEFGDWGGKKQSKENNIKVCVILGVKDWFNFCLKNESPDYFYNMLVGIDDVGWRNYAITRFLKTRVSISDESYFDFLGFKKNPVRKAKEWDNDVYGHKLDLKTTYLHGDYNTIEKVETDPIGFIKYTYGKSSGKKNKSERADIGFLNNRFFIVSHSIKKPTNKFLIESGYMGRYDTFDSLLNEFSDSNIFKLQAFNNSDSKEYTVESAVLIIYEDENGDMCHKLLKNSN